MTRIRARAPQPPWRVVFDGQSLNNIPGEEAYFGFTGTSYPRQLMSGRRVPWRITAVSGTSWTILENGGVNGNGVTVTAAATRVDPQAELADNVILVMAGGSSDLLSANGGDADSAVDAWANTVAYADNRRAAGFSHILGLTVPGNVLFLPAEETERQAYNALMLADAEDAFDAVIDVNATGLVNWLDETYYLTEHIHWNTNGARLAAETVAPYLEAILV